MRGELVQLNISDGGMPKRSIPSAKVTRDGVAGDWQRNRKYHGGPNRAICIYSEELYAGLRDQHGIELENGAVGENFTICGVDLQKLRKGDRLRIGQCVIEITDVRVPCSQLKKWDADLPELIIGRSGWMAKVVTEGLVSAGDEIEVLDPLPAQVPAGGGRA